MSAVEDLRAEALFASHLQPSDQPSLALVRDVVYAEVFQRREDGCAACVAQECGDHPDLFAERMAWCRRMVAEAFEFEAARP